jgi:hypothetical protein
MEGTGLQLVGDLPGITSYSFTAEDLDGEGTTRTETGVMHREIVRPDIVHASVTHRVTTADLATICEAIKTDPEIEGLDLYLPGVTSRTRKYYCSKYTAALVIVKEDTEWWDVSYELVEV